MLKIRFTAIYNLVRLVRVYAALGLCNRASAAETSEGLVLQAI